MMKKIATLFIFFWGVFIVSAQSEKLQAMEQELVFVHNMAKEMWFYSHTTNYDFDGDYYMQYDEMLTLIFGQFDKMLNKMLVEDKDMTYPFAALQNSGISGTKIVWSGDSLLRVFSWMLPGGTLQVYGNAMQYKNTKAIVRSFSFPNEYNKHDHDASYEYDTIYTLKDNDKTIYILSGRTLFSTRIAGYQLMAFSIQDEFVEKNIFEDENGITNKTSMSYEINCSDIDLKTSPALTIDVNKKIMTAWEMKEGCFTGKFIKYQFDGKKFKHISF